MTFEFWNTVYTQNAQISVPNFLSGHCQHYFLTTINEDQVSGPDYRQLTQYMIPITKHKGNRFIFVYNTQTGLRVRKLNLFYSVPKTLKLMCYLQKVGHAIKR